MQTQTSERRFVIRDDLDALRYARSVDTRLKLASSVLSHVYTRVDKVDNGFYITPDLRIAIASVRVLHSKRIPNSVFEDVYEGGVLHENSHAVLFPFMTRMNLTYAIVHEYAERAGIDFIPAIFNEVENIMSDIFNEIIMFTNRFPSHEKLPVVRYYYVFYPNRELLESELRNRAEVEADPLRALFITHNLVFASIYEGRLHQPRVPKPQWLSEHVYNALSAATRQFPIEDHVYVVNTGYFTSWIKELIHNGLLSNIDEFYNTIASLVSAKRVQLSRREAQSVYELLDYSDGVLRPYWAYYTVLAAYYRLTIERYRSVEDLASLLQLCVDRGAESRPPAPSSSILRAIFRQNPNELLSPELAEMAAKRLISTVLMVAKPSIVSETEVSVVKVPWYRRPRGRLDPMSLLKPSVLDWRVYVKTHTVSYRAKEASANVSVPDKITIVIDESGSTNDVSSILAPIIGIDTTVYDVERVTAMSMLLNVLNHGDVPTTLVRFSDDALVRESRAREVYEWFKNVSTDELMWGGTEIVIAVEEALRHHKDGRTNYFVLLTDMRITDDQARELRDLVFSRLKLSPVLIVGVNTSIPSVLEELNAKPNVAAIGVRTLNDYPKLESAIKKLVSIMYK